MKTYRCPVCKKPLTKKEYQEALGILEERDKHWEHEKADLKSKLRVTEAKAKKAREEGVKAERGRAERLMAGKNKQIQTLQERIAQLEKGTTPQTEGLEFEEQLAARLRREFPEDDIQHKGRDGDVLHLIKLEGKMAGTIIYECKRTPKIQEPHIRQAHRAKQTREADFAVLVTTGQRKGFGGLSRMNGVLVASPLAAIPLASVLRMYLIEMARARITKEKRALIAQELLGYITSPQYKNPIEDAVQRTSQLQQMIIEEAKDHRRIWNRRWEHYQTIRWSISKVKENVQLVLQGKEPAAIGHPKVIPLQLPAPTE